MGRHASLSITSPSVVSGRLTACVRARESPDFCSQSRGSSCAASTLDGFVWLKPSRGPRKVAVGHPGSDATDLFFLGVMSDACVEKATYLRAAVQREARKPQEPDNGSTSTPTLLLMKKFSQGQMPIEVRGWGMAGKVISTPKYRVQP